MNQTFYIVDNNALMSLTRRRVKSDFFRSYCRVPADVLREAEEHPDRSVLERTVYEVTPSVLEQIRNVMATVALGDTSLVDLYANKGSADPGLIASALDALAADEGKMFGDAWVIVTNDRAVLAIAAKHDLRTLAPDALAGLIDRA